MQKCLLTQGGKLLGMCRASRCTPIALDGGTADVELGNPRNEVMGKCCALPVLGNMWRDLHLLFGQQQCLSCQKLAARFPLSAYCNTCKGTPETQSGRLRTMKLRTRRRMSRSAGVNSSSKLKTSCAAGGKVAMVVAWGKPS